MHYFFLFVHLFVFSSEEPDTITEGYVYVVAQVIFFFNINSG